MASNAPSDYPFTQHLGATANTPVALAGPGEHRFTQHHVGPAKKASIAPASSGNKVAFGNPASAQVQAPAR